MKLILLVLVAVLTLGQITFVEAQERGLVSCDGTAVTGLPCDFCELIKTANNVIEYAVVLLVVILTIALAVTGLRMAMSQGNGDQWTILKSQLTNMVIGLLLILAAWTLVDTIMKVLVADSKTEQYWSFVLDVTKSSGDLCHEMMVPTNTEDTDLGGINALEGPEAVMGGATFTHSEAMIRLQATGISVTSSGNCSDRTRSNCTSLDGIKQNVINHAIDLKADCNCAVTITGGTEAGHAPGGHDSGRKYDVRVNAELDYYIRSTFRPAGVRGGDGAQLYKDNRGNIYAREGDHWDILVVQ